MPSATATIHVRRELCEQNLGDNNMSISLSNLAKLYCLLLHLDQCKIKPRFR